MGYYTRVIHTTLTFVGLAKGADKLLVQQVLGCPEHRQLSGQRASRCPELLPFQAAHRVSWEGKGQVPFCSMAFQTPPLSSPVCPLPTASSLIRISLTTLRIYNVKCFHFSDMMSPLQSARACPPEPRMEVIWRGRQMNQGADTHPFLPPIIHLFIIERGLAGFVMNCLLFHSCPHTAVQA